MPSQMTAPTPVMDTWTGFYTGVNAGMGHAEVTRGGAVMGGFDALRGINGGAQIGYNLQTGPAVFGVEADLQGAHMSQSINGATHTLQYFGTVRARVGLDIAGMVMPYLTAGIAGGGATHDLPPPGASSTKFHAGWTVGAGVEAKLSDNVSVKAEYLHLNLGEAVYFPVAGIANTEVEMGANIARIGVNFHF
ncbi:porin family protein [Devosia sp. CC-YST696]|nr:porin family protein [Devosia faecipullorum]